MNVPRKVRNVQRTLERKVSVVRKHHPEALIAGAAGAAAAVGLVVWGIVRAVVED